MSIKIEAATRLKSSEAEDDAAYNAALDKVSKLKKLFQQGKFPPKEKALDLISSIGGFVDQFTNKPPRQTDWRNQDAEKTKDGSSLYITIGPFGSAEIAVCIDYTDQVVYVS